MTVGGGDWEDKLAAMDVWNPKPRFSVLCQDRGLNCMGRGQ